MTDLALLYFICREIPTPVKAEKSTPQRSTPAEKKKRAVLDCGKTVNLTQYDHLRGISSRHSHPHIPEPEVAMIFRTKSGPDVDMNLLESQLRKAKKEVGRYFIKDSFLASCCLA